MTQYINLKRPGPPFSTKPTKSGAVIPAENLATALFKEVPSFPAYREIHNGDLFSLSLSDRSPGLTHGLHRFPAKYVARVPGWAIDQFAGKDDVVLDPFCGSGTTLVEALPRVHQSIGVDIDPLACMITRAKTGAVCPNRIDLLGAELAKRWRPSSSPKLPMPDLLDFTHWFTESAWGDLDGLMEAIAGLECSIPERDFFLCVFSSILRWVSNADDQTQKTYVSGTLKKSPPGVAATFWKTLQRAKAGLAGLQLARLPGAASTVLNGNASDLPVKAASVDLIVTSPPYMDSVDYMYNFMLEYFWLGPLLGVQDRKTFNQMRRVVVGAKKPLGVKPPALPACLDDLISVDRVDERRAAATLAYFQGMAAHFVSAARTLKPTGRYVFVVGNSQSLADQLPVHDALVRLAADAGLKFEKSFAYRIRRHYMKFPRAGRGGVITMDWVIVLRKARGPSPYPERLPLPDFTHRPDQVAN